MWRSYVHIIGLRNHWDAKGIRNYGGRVFMSISMEEREAKSLPGDPLFITF